MKNKITKKSACEILQYLEDRITCECDGECDNSPPFRKCESCESIYLINEVSSLLVNSITSSENFKE